MQQLKSAFITPWKTSWAHLGSSELMECAFPERKAGLDFSSNSDLNGAQRFAFIQRDELSSTLSSTSSSANSKSCQDSFLPWIFPWSSFFIPLPLINSVLGISHAFNGYKAFQRENKTLFTPKPLNVSAKHKERARPSLSMTILSVWGFFPLYRHGIPAPRNPFCCQRAATIICWLTRGNKSV